MTRNGCQGALTPGEGRGSLSRLPAGHAEVNGRVTAKASTEGSSIVRRRACHEGRGFSWREWAASPQVLHGGRLLLCWLALACSEVGAATLLYAGRLLHPDTAKVEQNVTLTIEGGKIVSVAPGRTSPGPSDTVIDLSQAWVLPGLMDTHTHLAVDVEAEQKQSESTSFRALRAVKNGQQLLQAGFTTVRDLGNEGHHALTDVRRAFDEKLFPGPTLLHAGKIIAPFGGQSGRRHPVPFERGTTWAVDYADADGPQQVMEAVRRNIYYGATVIKLVADQKPYFYSEEEIRAAAQEAHRAGLKLAVHVGGGQAATNAIQGGADSLEHGFDLSREQLLAMKRQGISLATTDFPHAHLLRIMQGNETAARKWSEKIVQRLRLAHEVGTPLTFGTDVAFSEPGRTRADLMFDYLSVWKAAGISPWETLRAMTMNAAVLLGISKERGTLRQGQYADLIAVKSNPLEDLESLRSIHFVMKEGQVIRFDR